MTLTGMARYEYMYILLEVQAILCLHNAPAVEVMHAIYAQSSRMHEEGKNSGVILLIGGHRNPE